MKRPGPLEGSMISGLDRGLIECGPSSALAIDGSDMANLVYSALRALDGYFEHPGGEFAGTVRT